MKKKISASPTLFIIGCRLIEQKAKKQPNFLWEINKIVSLWEHSLRRKTRKAFDYPHG